MTDTVPTVAPTFRALNDPQYPQYPGENGALRGREIVGPGYRLLILEAKNTERRRADPESGEQPIALAIDAYGAFWIIRLSVTVEGMVATYKMIRTDSVFRHSIFDALADFAEAR